MNDSRPHNLSCFVGIISFNNITCNHLNKCHGESESFRNNQDFISIYSGNYRHAFILAEFLADYILFLTKEYARI